MIGMRSCLALLFCLGSVLSGTHNTATVESNVVTDEWTLVHRRQSSGKYEDFAFVDARRGWLVSASGDVLHTTDGGMSWAVQAGDMGRLRSIDFLDASRGFAGTVEGVLYRTDNGGKSWIDITATLPKPPSGFCGITHVGERVHIVGRYRGNVADYFYSANGGRTWQVRSLLEQAQGLVDVAFLNADTGFIGGMAASGPPGAGPAVILKTVDGGKRWTQVFAHDGGRGFAWKIFPLDNKTILAALQSEDGTYRIARSDDAGDHWRVQVVATGRPVGPGIQAVGFSDPQRGWAGGFFEGLYETRDGGRSWSLLTAVADRSFNRIERVGDALVTAGREGGVWRFVVR